MYDLYIANKNYSSWSLRPWVLMSELGIAFREKLLVFGEPAAWSGYRKIAPAGKVPCLVDGDKVVWDSLSIVEYLAEHHPGVWPQDARTRAWARSAAAEMHSGFTELRSRCSMSCGHRIRLHAMPDALAGEIARLATLWNEGLDRFGGPYLAGSAFCAVDAFYAPVAFRIQTYGLVLDETAAAYAHRLLGLASMRRWYDAALAETYRESGHDADVTHVGEVLEDLRAT